MPYIDGFVLPVPKDKIEAYLDVSRTMGKLFREYGALEYHECVGDDVKPGKLTSFPQAVKLEENEIVIFSWIVFESRAKRDEINDKIMKDPRMSGMDPATMPGDMKRMFWGGFEERISL